MIRPIVVPDSWEKAWYMYGCVHGPKHAHKHTQTEVSVSATFPLWTPSYFPNAKYNFAFPTRTFIQRKHVGFPSPGLRNAEAELGWWSAENRIQSCTQLFICHNKEKKKQPREEATIWHWQLACVYVNPDECVCVWPLSSSSWENVNNRHPFTSSSLCWWRLFEHNWIEMLTASPWQRWFGVLAELCLMPPYNV